MLRPLLQAVLAMQLASGALLVGADQPPASDTAAAVDAAIAEAFFVDGVQPAEPTDDAAFARRVWLDIVGDIPTPEELTAFVLDRAPGKRARLVERLLAQPEYGQNWSRYWRDVVFSRAIEDRVKIAANATEVDLRERLNAGDGWDAIAAAFITAKGDVQENGACGIIAAADGRTEEAAAEVSRIFLGIQIQCAQCHDHPYDRWKREQFHELAAFFPRVGVRPVATPSKRSQEVFTNDRSGPRRAVQGNRPQPEHYMPDLENPKAKGSEMRPRFFLTGAELSTGKRDEQRREQLAEWLTDNEWFSIALVNRIWAELVSEGFYEPIDDIGPDREATAPEALRLLSEGFTASGHDLRWLLNAICRTEAYQREARPRRGVGGKAFVANAPQLLRGDQLYGALTTALGIDETDDKKPGFRGGFVPRYDRSVTTRQLFVSVFEYDPSVSRDEVAPAIPEVLALMNAPQIQRAVSAKKGTDLRRLLDAIDDDADLAAEVYLRCLSRAPTEDELAAFLDYRASTGKRGAAFEDLQWALVNSAEFRYRP
ncbi:MAG: DUF1549 domain-containing protein [Planctomycetota bacterium]